jgi:protein-tyrosine-phosphatase
MAGTQQQPPELLSLLADATGWTIVGQLARSDKLPRDLAADLGQPQEHVEHHLATLRELGLVRGRQSDVTPADTFYRLDLAAMREALNGAGAAIHPVVGGVEEVMIEPVPEAKARVLILCTGNSARSQMAEGLMRYLSQGTVEVFSAGTQPSQVHPLAIQTMAKLGIDISQQHSKHLDEFRGQQFDYVITVCDRQHEVCPTFPGEPQNIHWSFGDPVEVEPEESRQHAFRSIANQLRNLTKYFLIFLDRKTEEKNEEEPV